MLKRSRALASVGLIALAMGAGAAPAGAETLQDAIGLAYRTNPTLLAQRANQRALKCWQRSSHQGHYRRLLHQIHGQYLLYR